MASDSARTRQDESAQLRDALRDLVRATGTLRSDFTAAKHISISEFRALTRIVGQPGLKPKDITEALGFTTGAVTALIDRLVSLGHVRREANPDDRRSLLLYPTEEGSAVVRELLADYDLTVARAVDDTDPEIIPAVTEAIRKISKTLGEAFTPPAPDSSAATARERQ